MSEHVTEGMVQGPDGTILRFFYDPAKNDVATAAEGRPIFDTVLFMDVITPGQKASTPRFEVEREWSEHSKKHLNVTEPTRKSYRYNQFREQIERFKADEGGKNLGGTPLKEWPRINRALAATLAGVNVFTVESLAVVNDSSLHMLGMGGRELRDAARAFLNQGDAAQVSAMAAKITHLEEENERRDVAFKEAMALVEQAKQEVARLTGIAQASQGAAIPAVDPLAAAEISQLPPPIETVKKRSAPKTADPLA